MNIPDPIVPTFYRVVHRSELTDMEDYAYDLSEIWEDISENVYKGSSHDYNISWSIAQKYVDYYDGVIEQLKSLIKRLDRGESIYVEDGFVFDWGAPNDLQVNKHELVKRANQLEAVKNDPTI